MSEMEIKCEGCRETLAAGTRFCGKCGREVAATPTPPLVSTCASCGAVTKPADKFCHACGKPIPSAVRTPSMPDAAKTGGTPAPAEASAPPAHPAPPVLPARAPVGFLRILSADSGGKEFPIASDVVRIGQEAGADVQLSGDSFVSHAHARVLARASGVEIEDLGSRNGTYVQIRDRHVLRSGDRLLIGATVLEYRENPSASH